MIQSMLFKVKKWTASEARHWLKSRGYRFKKIDTTTNYHRFRQISPKVLKNRGYSRFRIVNIGPQRDEIKAVVAF